MARTSVAAKGSRGKRSRGKRSRGGPGKEAEAAGEQKEREKEAVVVGA